MLKPSKLTESEKEMIVYNHYFKNLDKKKLKSIRLTLDQDNLDFVTKQAKKLNIDKDAIIGYILYNFLERSKK